VGSFGRLPRRRQEVYRGHVRTTYHLVPRAIWEASRDPYAPASLTTEGFVHCTDGAEELAATANRYFADERDEVLALMLDLDSLSAPVTYEDPRRVYPHVYGPIPRQAILQVLPMPRDGSGVFLPPQS
jgi:uncharacterized protein (DUF952 family)